MLYVIVFKGEIWFLIIGTFIKWNKYQVRYAA